MDYEKTKIQDCIVIRPKVFHDQRGMFFETYNNQRYLHDFIELREGPGHPIGTNLIQSQWRQTNCSVSAKNVVRGIHIAPFAKLVMSLQGHVWDVVVDMRKDSPTYLEWVGIDLLAPKDSDYVPQIYVPNGCGHGFFCREEGSVVLYSQTGVYDPKVESSVHWRDPTLAIRWPHAEKYILSPKDEEAPRL